MSEICPKCFKEYKRLKSHKCSFDLEAKEETEIKGNPILYIKPGETEDLMKPFRNREGFVKVGREYYVWNDELIHVHEPVRIAKFESKAQEKEIKEFVRKRLKEAELFEENVILVYLKVRTEAIEEEELELEEIKSENIESSLKKDFEVEAQELKEFEAEIE